MDHSTSAPRQNAPRLLPRRIAAFIAAVLLCPLFLLLLHCAAPETGSATPDSLVFVSSGKSVGIVVIPRAAAPSVQAAAKAFVNLVARSTGATLPVVSDDNEAELLPDRPRLFIGDCRQTAAAGLQSADLGPETYRLAFRGHDVHVLGEPARQILKPSSKVDPWYDSDPLRWALNDLLEEQLGVRWLWPGTLGTYVPKQKGFTLPARDRTYQPRLKMRKLIIATMRSPEERNIRTEALEWVANHQGGEREDIPFGHGFNDWWEKYHVSHPDYFATPPEGESQRPPGYVKLNLTNPAVLDQIAINYKEAGMPEYWNVTPNDGAGFDVSKGVREWDIPTGQSIKEIWGAKANLTVRYIRWWNMIYERLSRLNPKVKLVTMAYSSYRLPPPDEYPLKARALLGIVPSYRAYDVWAGWAKVADELILRPNWGHYGANGPHLALTEMADYIRFASKNKMVGFYMDSVLGFWGTQGLNYYLMARLMVDPERPVASIIEEYVAAFGKGAPKIAEYFGYWQQTTASWAHGHYADRVKTGKYDALICESKIVDNPFLGPRQALPYIYTDAVLAKAYALLDEADELIGDKNEESSQRVDFLRQGLNELRATRDCIALGRSLGDSPSEEALAELRQKARLLDELRARLTPSHAVWGGVATRREKKLKIRMRPENIKTQESSGHDEF